MNGHSLYLTATGRLARRLRHRFRMRCIDEGVRGWYPPRIMSLNAWLQRLWSASWPQRVPAPDISRTRLWHRLITEMPPPAPLEGDLGLCGLLDDTYGVMIRHRLKPSAGVPSTPLVEWRRAISGAFARRLTDDHCFHPAELPRYVGTALSEGTIPLPGSISLAGFDAPSPIEADLFALLEQSVPVEHHRTGREHPADVEAVALPTPEQEIHYLIHRLCDDAQSIPLHRVGVIAPDLQACQSLLEGGLTEVLGSDPPAGSQWFNITLGTSLLDAPLVRAALLPLQLITGGEERETFLSLLLSPYYRCWQGRRQALARADRHWRHRSIAAGLDAMLDSLSRGAPALAEMILAGGAGDLRPFCARGRGRRNAAGSWIEELTTLWTRLGFPVISDETDTVAWRHLSECLHDMEGSMAGDGMTAQEFLSWMSHVLSGQTTHTGASEEAGIQVMGLIEARGLDFDRIYVLDMHDRSLPQPVRPLPLLDSLERQVVQGGTVRNQYEFAERAFQGILHAAPQVTLLRALQRDSRVLSPSPFWPAAEMRETMDIWNDAGPAWSRAPWLGASLQGLSEPVADLSQVMTGDFHPGPAVLPTALSISDMEGAITCPYLFFVSRILGIEELESVRGGVSPRDRGICVHTILAHFTRRLRAEGIDLSDREGARELLRQCTAEEFRGVQRDPHWQVEERLLMDTDTAGEPGLLMAWLDAEEAYRHTGWRCIAEEAEFSDLSDDGWPFSLRGRIDRIDYSKEGGLVCWDYKTGNTPTATAIVGRYTAPQLPLYLMAIGAGRVSGLEDYRCVDTPLSAGYMQVKSLKAVKIAAIEGIEGSLGRWRDIIADLGEILRRGDFPARPYPVSPGVDGSTTCRDCPFISLCEKGIFPAEMLND